MDFIRLRQIALVAQDLELPAQQICDLFGLEIAHRDPHLAGLGLHNVMIPIGTSFLEIVSPIREGTTAERFLTRRGGDGGYMFICDCSDFDEIKTRARDLDIRFIAELKHDDEPIVDGVQLHPKDTGGAAMLEFDQHGSGGDLLGDYRWAGPEWQKAIRQESALAIEGAEIQSADPAQLADRWSQVFGLDVTMGARGTATTGTDARICKVC